MIETNSALRPEEKQPKGRVITLSGTFVKKDRLSILGKMRNGRLTLLRITKTLINFEFQAMDISEL